MSTHFFEIRRSAFLLWRPLEGNPPPKLIIGTFRAGNPPSLTGRMEFTLKPLENHSDLWGISAADCGLVEGQVYHYWFEVTDSSPRGDRSRVACTDPFTRTVDWRLRAPRLPAPYDDDDRDPAAVIMFQNGVLVACDAGGEPIAQVRSIATAASNHKLVIYELPTSWSASGSVGEVQIGVGTFRDVIALLDPTSAGANFADVAVLLDGRSYLTELGINALELLPPADSFVDREWGYATSNYFAPDFDLGFPRTHSWPTSNLDLVRLVDVCHAAGIRFFMDVVMAFGTRCSLENINFPEFHIDQNTEHDNPDSYQSGGQGKRSDFGGKLWRYGRTVNCYDPLSGKRGVFNPARLFMKAYLLRWMNDFAVDGVRIDSVNNVANWDFIEEFKNLARETWQARNGSPDKFIVVGEELSVPLELLHQKRLDGLWNEEFKHIARSVILGQNSEREPSFEWSVRKMIDCRLLGFEDGAQAVNYLGSHDVEGYRNERLFNFLENNGVVYKEERIKLAFVCLLTAVGIPMIFAGDEFADEHDLAVRHPEKQRDAVNFSRLAEPFRKRIFGFVARLIKLRTTHEALSVNEVDFIHLDFDDRKRVIAWRRGKNNSNAQIVVVANFSDFSSVPDGNAAAEYRVRNWPHTPLGKKWREVSQERDIPNDWVGREPLYPWEAKVYAIVD